MARTGPIVHISRTPGHVQSYAHDREYFPTVQTEQAPLAPPVMCVWAGTPPEHVRLLTHWSQLKYGGDCAAARDDLVTAARSLGWEIKYVH